MILMSLELSDTVYLMQCVLAVHDKKCCQNPTAVIVVACYR